MHGKSSKLLFPKQLPVQGFVQISAALLLRGVSGQTGSYNLRLGYFVVSVVVEPEAPVLPHCLPPYIG